MKQASLLALTLASSGVLAIPAPNIFDPIASAISNTLKKWEGSSCDGDCRTGFGWDGRVMGNDPWGMPLNPGQPSGYLAPSSSSSSGDSSAVTIANVGYNPTGQTKPAPSSSKTSATLTTASATPSSSSSSAAPTPSPSDGVVKIFNAPSPSSDTAPAPPTDGSFSIQDTSASSGDNKGPGSGDNSGPGSSDNSGPGSGDNSGPAQPETTPPPPPPPTPPPPATNSNAPDIQQYLDAHNAFRAQHGAAPLTWSDQLQGFAESWANNCDFNHSGGKFGRVGENLAAGTGPSYTIQAAIKDWTDESSSYDPNNPQPSHFTQVVWKETTQVGCSLAKCGGIFDASFGPASYYVCEYLPAGNIIGHFTEQVQP